MNTIVVFKSSTGFTKKYAQWIAKRLGCEIKELKSVKAEQIADYDRVIYGGWIMGNMIMGLDKINKMNPKNLVIFSVGAAPNCEKTVKDITTQSKIEGQPFFYFQGGIDYDKLGFVKGKMLKTVSKSIMKKPDKTEADAMMAQTMMNSYDHTNIEAIEPLIEYVG